MNHGMYLCHREKTSQILIFKEATMTKFNFDAFMSYNRNDEPLVKQIANELIEAGIKVWFDEWEAQPGQKWKKELSRGIRESNSIIVFIGPSGVGPWEEQEIENAIDQYVNQGCSVIPVILPGVEKVPELPPFLNQFNWVDCRSRQTSQVSLDRLIWGITGRKPLRSISQISGEFFLKLEKPGKVERYIKIYTLQNPNIDKLLDLTWETFGIGIENLQGQIKNYGARIHFDACFGINDAGLVMATFLNIPVMGRVKIGYIRYKGLKEGEIISDDDSFFPGLGQKPTIMLMDFEIKSGTNFKIAVNRIRQKYPGAKIYFSVFSALTEKDNLKINCFEDLKAADNIKALEIEDLFIACTIKSPGIEPPLGLR